MNRRSMKKAVAAAAVAACASFTAVAASEQMASRKLVERRIAETSTNLTEKIVALRTEIANLIATQKQVSSNKTSSAAKDFMVTSILVTEELKNNNWADCPYYGDFVREATDSRYGGTYLVSAKQKRVEDGWTVYWATNTYIGISSYEARKIDGSTTNFLHYVLTPDGERYERVKPYAKTLSRTFVCTTNEQRKIVLEYRKFNEEAFRIIMGTEGDR